MTWGSQKWRGAAPIFIPIPTIKKVCLISIKLLELLKKIKDADIIIIIDARAWVIKYLILASEEDGLILLIIRGISLIRLISKPNQHENHEEDEIAIKVPVIKVDVYKLFLRLIKI